MSEPSTLHLLEMANQIALNLAHGKEQEQCIDEIANHIQRFWAPSMRVQLISLVAQNNPQLNQLVSKAVSQLSDYSTAK